MKGKYIRGNIDEEFSLSTLASKTLLSNQFDENVTEKTLLSSIQCTWSLDNITVPQGPILFGIAHSDYTDPEIEEVIEATESWNLGNKVAQEVGRRLVRQIGVFVVDVGNPSVTTQDIQFNEGKPVKTRLNWSLQTGATLRHWAYNISASALSNTSPVMRCNGKANLWQK